MERIIFIPWENVSLVVPEKEDFDVMYKAMNNVNIIKYLRPIQFYTKEMEQKFLDTVLNWEHKMLVIMKNDTREIIGSIWFNEFSENNRSWKIWMTLYDEKFFWKWYWSEALKLFLKYSFEYLWLNKVKLHVFSHNERAIKSYEKCWFKKVWVLKEETYIMWKYEDENIMEILRSEYK